MGVKGVYCFGSKEAPPLSPAGAAVLAGGDLNGFFKPARKFL
jgi:hypothetical protein